MWMVADCSNYPHFFIDSYCVEPKMIDEMSDVCYNNFEYVNLRGEP